MMFFKYKFIASLILVIFAQTTLAVVIEEQIPSAPSITEVNGVTVVKLNGASFSIADVPTFANGFENSTTTDTNAELKGKLPRGELANREEVLTVINAYYEKNAFDNASVVIRGLKVGTETSWAIWCANPWIFGCLEHRGSGGTWVEFEANGRNRSGGMTGFQRTIWMVRKFSQPQEPSAVK